MLYVEYRNYLERVHYAGRAGTSAHDGREARGCAATGLPSVVRSRSATVGTQAGT